MSPWVYHYVDTRISCRIFLWTFSSAVQLIHADTRKGRQNSALYFDVPEYIFIRIRGYSAGLVIFLFSTLFKNRFIE